MGDFEPKCRPQRVARPRRYHHQGGPELPSGVDGARAQRTPDSCPRRLPSCGGRRGVFLGYSKAARAGTVLAGRQAAGVFKPPPARLTEEIQRDVLRPVSRPLIFARAVVRAADVRRRLLLAALARRAGLREVGGRAAGEVDR